MDYSELVKTYDALENTTKRLEKSYHIAKFLMKMDPADLEESLFLLQGQVFPAWDERKIGVAAKLIVKAINVATGINKETVESEWKKTGDLGLTAENLTKNKKQATLFQTRITVKKVFSNIKALAQVGGSGSVDQKIQLIAELLTSAEPLEARYIVRTVLEELRVGVGDGTLRDATAWAYFPKIVGIFFRCKACDEWNPKTDKCLNCGKEMKCKFSDEISSFTGEPLIIATVDEYKNKLDNMTEFVLIKDETIARQCYNHVLERLQESYDLTNDFSVVAKAARDGLLKGLDQIKIKVGFPLNLMLYLKAKDIANGFERVGKPCALEYKYDGFRLAIHGDLKSGKIMLFTRRLEDVSPAFPDVVNIIKDHVNADNFILDAEIIGIDPKTKKWLPFQHISKRIKRKYDIEQIQKEIPVMINVFDILLLNDESLLKTPFNKRRELLGSIVKQVPEKMELAKQIITDDLKEAQAFYDEALRVGNEGIMMKNLESVYKPGSRVGFGMKVKPVMETLDLVIVGAEWGEGKRSGWFTSFVIACIDDGRFVEVGKVGTGFKEKEESGGLSFEELTKMLKPLIISEKGKEIKVKPEIVIEINYEEIQRSPSYSSGYALRFPRLVRLREDRRANEISTLQFVEELYDTQKGKSE